MVTIRIDNDVMDTVKDEFVELTFKANDFTNSKIAESFSSNEFEIVLTTNNNKILKFASDSNIDEYEYSREILKGDILIRGSWIPVRIYVTSVDISNRKAKIFVAGNNAGWVDKVLKSEIKDYNWNEYDHDWDPTGIEQALSNDSGYTYILTGTDNGVGYWKLGLDSGGDVLIENYRYAFYVKDMIRKVLKANDITIKGDLLDDPRYKKLGLMSGVAKFKYSDPGNWVPAQRADDLDQFTISTNTDERLTYNNLNGGDLTTGGGRTYFTAPKASFYKFGASISVNETSAHSSAAFIYPVVYINNTDEVQLDAMSYGTGSFEKNDITEEVFLNEGDTISLAVRRDTIGSGTFTVGVTEDQFFFEEAKRVGYGGTMTVESAFPKLKLKDVFETVTNMFQVIWQYDINSDILTASLSKNVVRNIGSNSVDWTSKIDLSQDIVIDRIAPVQDYARNNIWEYSSDDKDTFTNNETGQGVSYNGGKINIDNANIAESKEVFTSKFIPAYHQLYKVGEDDKVILGTLQEYLLPLTFMKYSDVQSSDLLELDWEDTKIRIGLIDDTIGYNFTDSDSEIGITTLYNVWGGVLNTTHSTYKTMYSYGYYDSYDGDLIKDGIAYDNNSEGDGFATLFDSYFELFQQVTDKQVLLTAFFRLGQNDIDNLDFTIPVYIAAKGIEGYYYLNSIEGYNDSGSAVECQLLKL